MVSSRDHVVGQHYHLYRRWVYSLRVSGEIGIESIHSTHGLALAQIAVRRACMHGMSTLPAVPFNCLRLVALLRITDNRYQPMGPGIDRYNDVIHVKHATTVFPGVCRRSLLQSTCQSTLMTEQKAAAPHMIVTKRWPQRDKLAVNSRFVPRWQVVDQML